MKNRILLGLLLCLTQLAFAQNNKKKEALESYGIQTETGVPKGLKKGDKAPDFTLTNQIGKTTNLQQMLREGPVVLVFYRGAWCPYCTRYLNALDAALQDIQAAGAQVVAISPQSTEGQELPSAYPIVCDSTGEVMESYGVQFQVNDSYQEKLDNYLNQSLEDINAGNLSTLPVPATYVIGQNGKIKRVFFDPNYTNRASIEDLLKALN